MSNGIQGEEREEEYEEEEEGKAGACVDGPKERADHQSVIY